MSQITDENSDTGQKLIGVYDGLNIALYDSEGQMRSSYDILSDLSTKWDSLSKNQQNYIALTSAGSNQLNAFLALMNNFGHATKATETAMNSAGSATKENGRYMESLQAQIQALKAEFQEFATNILSSDLVKGFLQAGTAILKFANTDLGQAIAKILLFNVTINGLSGVFGRFSGLIGNIISPMGGLNIIFKKASEIFSKFGIGATEAGSTASGLSSIVANLSEVFNGLGSGVETGTKALSVLGNVAKGIISVLGPIGTIIGAIAIAGAAAYRHFNVTAEEQAQVVTDLSDKISDLKSEYQSLAGKSDLTEIEQAHLQVLQQEIEANEKLLAQEAQKSYEKSFGAGSEHEVEVDDTTRDFNVNQYNELQAKIEEATNKVQTLNNEWEAMDDKSSEAAKSKYNELETARKELQKLQEEQNQYNISDSGTTTKTGLEEIQDNIKNLEALKDQISKNSKEILKGADNAKELDEENQKLDESYTALNASTAEQVESLRKIGEQMGGLPEDAQAVVDAWDDYQKKQEEIAHSAENLEAQMRSIADVEIKPKDADSMGEWLQSLSDDTLAKLQDMLQLVGQNAEGLAAILSGMSDADAINYITEAYKEYYGIIDDATQATDEFNRALNKNYAESIENQLTMIDYIEKSQSEGITNAKAYKAALEGVYGTSDKNLIKMADNIAAVNTEFNKTGTVIGNYKSYFTEGVDGVSKFFTQLSDISKSTNEDLQGLVTMTGSIETGDLEVTIDDFGKLADRLGLSETGLKSLIDYMQVYGDINIGESIDGTTANLQKLADGLDVVNDKFKTLIGSKDTDVFGGSLGTGEVKINLSTEEAKQKAVDFVNTVNKQTAEITGTEIEFDVNADDAETQLENVYNYVQNLQKYVNDEGNWDFSSVTDKLKDVDDITIDGNKIKIEGGEEQAKVAGEKLKQAILNGVNEDSAEGQTLLANFFNNVDVSGADDAAQKVVDALKNSIDGKLNTTEIAVEGAFKTTADNMGLVVTSADNATDAVNKTGQAIDEANQKNLNGLKGSVDDTKGSVDNLNSSLSSVSTYVGKLQNKKINVTVNYVETNKPKTVGGTVIVQNTGGKAVGQIPAYANGKNLDGTTPMRMQSSGNALVGEEGAEFRITKDGKKELLGKQGAEIAHVDKGDTIIPADVTEMIRKGQLEGYDKGKTGSGKTSVSASLMAKPTGSFQLSDIKSKYDDKQIVSNNKLTSSFSSTTKATTSNTQATKSNTAAKSSNASASKFAADATDELADAQKEQKEAFEDANDVLEHHIYLAEKNGASYDKLIEMNQNYQKQLNEQANWWRKQGFSDDSEEIRSLQKQWWQVEDDITSYQEKAFDERYQESKDYIDDRNDLADWGADNEIAAWHRVETWMDEWYARGAISYEYYIEKRKEATKKAAEAEKKAWKEAKEAEQDRLESWKEVYEDLFDLVADKAQEEIDKLNDQRDEVEQYWDDRIDALEKVNDELDDQIEKEEALDQLARARSTKVMVYQDGRFQYINDTDEVSEAQSNLDKLERDQALEREKENLEKQKDAALKAIDEQIDSWEKYKEEWSSVVSDYEKEQKRLNVLQKLGVDLEAANWKERLGNLDNYVTEYKKYAEELERVTKELNEQLTAAVGDVTIDSDKVAFGVSGGSTIGAGIGVGIGGAAGAGGAIGGAIGGIIGAISTIKNTTGSSSSKGSSSSGSSSSDSYSSGSNRVISSDKGYTISTSKGTSFVDSAPTGSTMTGGDGSKWTKNSDGSTTIKTKDGTTHTVSATTTSKRASGTKYAPRGMTLVGEEGAELRVLNQGDGIIPHDMTANLFEWGQTKPSDMIAAFVGNQGNSGVTIHIENFNPSLPNVTDGEGFANYLKNNFWRNVMQFKTTMGRA